MSIKKLRHTVDSISVKHGDHQPHGTSVRLLVGQQGMRVIGRAFDLGIIKEKDAAADSRRPS